MLLFFNSFRFINFFHQHIIYFFLSNLYCLSDVYYLQNVERIYWLGIYNLHFQVLLYYSSLFYIFTKGNMIITVIISFVYVSNYYYIICEDNYSNDQEFFFLLNALFTV